MPEPFVIGLTGSIAMGKSETARLFAEEGVPVHDPDAAIGRLYGKGGAAVEEIARHFPGVVRDGAVDRARLSALVTADAAALKKLEALVHPLVARERDEFLRGAAAKGEAIVVLDIPLLFETGADKEMDALVVASAPQSVQRARALSRPGMTAEKFESLLARQLPDVDKRGLAHFVVVTDQGLEHARAQVKMILAAIREKLRKMREIVFDTETTGFEPDAGHRIVEIGCVELVDHFPTGKTFQAYLNPEREVPIESQRVHGLSNEFLSDKPLFAAMVEEFLGFIGDAPLVIHNASFDIKFINAELARTGHAPIPLARAIDTIEIAKRKIPGARYSLDELCKRFGVDLSGRAKHGALLDADLTAQIYLELIGGRQRGLALAPVEIADDDREPRQTRARQRPEKLAPRISESEIAAHLAFIQELGEDAIWNLG